MLTDAMKFVRDTELPSDADLDERIRNIEAAKDCATPKAILASAADNTASAQVNAGSLTSFTERLSGDSKSAVMNSTLFAQLAADKAVDRYAAPMDWYKKYIEVLGRIGWNQPAFAFDTYTSGDAIVKLNEAVLNILTAIATGNEVAVVGATMDALKNLSDDSKQMTVWDAHASSGNNGNFQIMPVDKLANGDVVMVLTGMQFNASTSHGRFLWWEWSSTSIKIQRAASKFVLNWDVYSQASADVIQKLGKRAQQLVADIDI
jgi:hypothetical protein